MNSPRPLKTWVEEQYQKSIQILFTVGAIIILAVCVATGYVIQSENGYSITNAFTSSMRNWVNDGDILQIKQATGQLIDKGTIDFAEVYDTKGSIIQLEDPLNIQLGSPESKLIFAGGTLVKISCINYGDPSEPGKFCFGKSLSLRWFLLIGLSFLFFFVLVFIMFSKQNKKLSNFLSAQLISISEQTKNPDQNIGSAIEIEEVRDTIHEIKAFSRKQADTNQKLQELDTAKRLSEMASQLAHDIRSPLAVLELSSSSLGDSSEQTRNMIRGAIGRIKDIANTVGIKKPSDDSLPNPGEEGLIAREHLFQTPTLLSPIIEQIISEKKLEWGREKNYSIDYEMDRQSYGIFAMVNDSEFKRVISNLLNNSFESFKDHGQIRIRTRTEDNEVILTISDNGCGIPTDFLKNIGTKGNSFGKINGSGLGLFHAKNSIENWGGNLIVESAVDSGTIVKLELLKATPPSWFVSKLNLVTGSSIVIFDDDPSIHQVWEGRFSSLQLSKSDIKTFHLSTTVSFRKFYRENFSDLENPLFLIDYEILGSTETGLDTIQTLGIETRSVLVTSRYDEAPVRERAEKMGVRIIPKSLSVYIPIHLID